MAATTADRKSQTWGAYLSSWLPGSKSVHAPDTSEQQAVPQQEEAVDAADQPQEETSDDLGDITNDLTGQWQKDTAASDLDNYQKQVFMLKMSKLYTYAALHYMWGLEIHSDEQGLDVKFLVKSVPAWVFADMEHFKYDTETTMKRRDHRSGQQTAVLTKIDGGVQNDIHWGNPLAGSVREIYTMPAPNRLHIESTLTIDDQSITALQVYNKK